MKKFKIISLLFVIFLFTGCSGSYDVIINEDLSITEQLNLELQNTGDEYNKTLKIFNDNKVDRDNYNVSINGSKVIINYSDKFNSIDDYILNSKIYHQLIDEIKYSKIDNYIDIYVDQNLKLKNDGNNIGNVSDIDFLQVNIKNPYKTIISNEDSYNENTYTWNITKDNINKKILMQFETKTDKVPYGTFIMVVVLSISIFSLAYIIVKNYRNANKI